jgi:hypothetical protein
VSHARCAPRCGRSPDRATCADRRSPERRATSLGAETFGQPHGEVRRSAPNFERRAERQSNRCPKNVQLSIRELRATSAQVGRIPAVFPNLRKVGTCASWDFLGIYLRKLGRDLGNSSVSQGRLFARKRIRSAQVGKNCGDWPISVAQVGKNAEVFDDISLAPKLRLGTPLSKFRFVPGGLASALPTGGRVARSRAANEACPSGAWARGSGTSIGPRSINPGRMGRVQPRRRSRNRRQPLRQSHQPRAARRRGRHRGGCSLAVAAVPRR